MTPLFVGKEAAAMLLGCSVHTLKDWRYRYWTEGLEFNKPNSRSVRYSVPLLTAWAVHRNDPAAYKKAIENYQAGLLSNQPRRAGRPQKVS